MVEQVRQHTFHDATQKMKEGAIEFKDAIKESAMGSVQSCTDYCTQSIQENPYKSVLIAFGIGMVFGALMMRD